MDLANNFVILARKLASNNSLKKAFDMYMIAFEKCGIIKERYEDEFRGVLSKLNEELAAVDNKTEIFANFQRAIKAFPFSVDMLNDIGKYLYRYGYFSEALCHFERALNFDSSFVSIEKNLNNSKSFLLPRGLFRMLNDRVRNDAYRRAIESSVTHMDSVIDIDCGTGLLALYADACHPISTTACESSYTMSRLAECVLRDNGAPDVVIFNKPSVILAHVDIYGTRSVLLTDLLDSGLFGEYILQCICHAWESLLYRESKIIPGRAEYFIVGAKCEQAIKKYQLCAITKNVLNVAHLNVHTTTYYGETYYSEDIHLYDDLKFMTEPQSLLKINFNDYYDVYEKLHRQEPYEVELKAIEDGEIDTIIGYFDLHLTDDITISTDPLNSEKTTAWQQAIFFEMLPKKLKRDETANIRFLSYGGRLTTLPQANTQIMRISPETLAFLNDTKYMEIINRCLATVCIYLGQMVDISSLDIVDLSPFPMFGIQMLKRGANSLICHAKALEDKAFLKAVMQANDIIEDKVTILISDQWSHETFKDKKFHVIFCNTIDLSGDLDPRRKRVSHHLRTAHLTNSGLFLPHQVTIMGQLVSSEWLEVNNRVLDENVDGYKMAEHVNRYQVSQAIYVDLARLRASTNYRPLSEPFVVAECSDTMNCEAIKVPVVEDGECTALICWYKVQLLEDLGEISTDRSNSFVEGTAYMNSSNERLFRGDEVTVLRCVEPDGTYKLVMDV